jgi:uncharacterized protein YjbJ (UPF0337 family)
LLRSINKPKGTIMDKNRISGAGDKAKGEIKEVAGKMTGDVKLQAEGKADKAKGAVKSAIGGAADTMRNSGARTR